MYGLASMSSKGFDESLRNMRTRSKNIAYTPKLNIHQGARSWFHLLFPHLGGVSSSVSVSCLLYFQCRRRRARCTFLRFVSYLQPDESRSSLYWADQSPFASTKDLLPPASNLSVTVGRPESPGRLYQLAEHLSTRKYWHKWSAVSGFRSTFKPLFVADIFVADIFVADIFVAVVVRKTHAWIVPSRFHFPGEFFFSTYPM